MNRAFWVRRGENRANLPREFSDQRVDRPLAARGFYQAEHAAGCFASISIAAISSSPLRRTRGTAEIAAARSMRPLGNSDEFCEIVVDNFRKGRAAGAL